MADRRDGITWVALELTRQGELLIEEGTLAEALRRELGVDEDWPVFIPSRMYERKGRRMAVHLMEGYAFVASGLDEVRYFRLEQSKLVEQVLAPRTSGGIRVLTTIPDDHIVELRHRLSEEMAADIVPGMRVAVTEGVYKGLEGTVMDMEGEHAVVYFELRSLKSISKVPKVFLDTPE